MSITLVRVDDRIIHGQITTRRSRARRVHGIIVVGDKVANDDLRKRVLKAAAGKFKLGIYPTEYAVDKIKQAKEHEKPYFIIAESPQVYAKLLKLGADFGDTLNIGPMNTRPGAKVLGRTAAVDEKDYEAFDYIENKGIKINFQLLPDDDIRTWERMRKIYDSMD